MGTLRLLAVLIVVAAMPSTVVAGTWQDDLDSYPTGSLIAGQGGWQTWDNNPAFDTIVTNAQSSSPPNSLLVSGPANVLQPFPGGAPTGDLFVWVYVPSSHAGEIWLTVPSAYAPGGPYSWAVRVVMCVSACTSPGAIPGQIVNIGGDGVPGVGSTILPTDQWFQLWVIYNVPPFGYNYAVGLNGGLFTPFLPWSGPSFQAVNVFSNNGTAAYMDGFELEQFVPVELMTFSVE